jgi:hypothetical protein
MKQAPPAVPQGLRLLCQEAGKQATSWASDTALSGAAADAASASPWWLRAGMVGGTSLLALVVCAAPFLGEFSGPMRAPVRVLPQAAAVPFVAPTGEGLAPVQWQGKELLIAFDQIPLAQAIMLLATATNTSVNGVELLLAPVSVTVHLRSADARAAWERLLRGRAVYSMSCSASTCKVWITSEVSAPTATAAQDAEQTPPSTGREPPAGVTREELESQPDGSC